MPGASSAADSAGWATSSIAVADRPGSAVKPTIVFVHGAFADASGFAASIGYLQHAGYPVLAPANADFRTVGWGQPIQGLSPG
jgi:pimeloyl-ACP methyl ester carboxylesterase